MNGSQLRLILMLVMLTLIVPLFLEAQVNKFNSKEISTAQQNLQHASMAALQVAYEYSDGEELTLFETDTARQTAVDTFFTNFTASLGTETYANNFYYARYLVPVIAMVDYDGYYLMYAKTINASDGQQYVDVITPINTYSETISNMNIRYYLSNNRVDVIDLSTNKTFTGSPQDVYAALLKEYDTSQVNNNFSFLNDIDAFNTRRTNFILDILQSSLNYTINTHNTLYNMYDANYTFVMPRLKGDFQDVLDGPTFLAFEQGQQLVDTSNSMSNIYALASADVIGFKYYYLVQESDGLYYHSVDCTDLTDEQKSKAVLATAKYCAAHGANPERGCVK